MSKLASLNTLENWIDSYLNFEKTPKKNIFWLDTMKFFCQKFGHPENYAPCFHVGGSKGKGSISAFISYILDAAGFKTGLYTSPHILDFIERVASAHGYFEASAYDAAVSEIMNGVQSISSEELPGQRPITWFELVTLFGFLVFRQAKVDYSVYEVGLGGKLDSTNVVDPICACIGPIELEHTEFLGDTVEKIAGEKAGIIKKDRPVVVAKQVPSVKKVFQDEAKSKNAQIFFVDEEISNLCFDYDEGMRISFESKHFSRPIQAKLKLLGEFQAWNAAQAALAVKIAVPQITEEQIEAGLEKATLPARFETIKNPAGFNKIPMLILDGAHTVNSIRFTLETMENVFKKNKTDSKNLSFHLLFAAAADKDVADIAPLFQNKFEKITLTIPGTVKQSNLAAVEEAFSKAGMDFCSDADYPEQIKKALELASASKSVLLVTGSFYLVSEVKKTLGTRLPTPQVTS
ncbi:MAG: bifunctional folylpolyglutamate synthase/dihydrofolate synthase [Treponema sp.]|nr:bifunctional folylpolyglutamate synthase/dihydrofolate synthase [Candidatus Treponema equifaecale]